jgi:pimeloyl-ACP methyl ester carboxylesterase
MTSDCRIAELSSDGAMLASWHGTGDIATGGTTYEINGHEMFIQCVGEGSPTILWEAGGDMAGWTSTAQYVQGRLAATTRICVYDRAGLGMSEPSEAYAEGDGWLDVTADLDALLRAAGVGGPLIVAGHSYGGFLARLFAYQHRDEVVGILAIDPSSEDWYGRPGQDPDPDDIAAVRELSGGRIAGSLEAMPLIVIGHALDQPFLAGASEAAWLESVRETVRASSNSVFVTASWSGHMIPTAQPALVFEALRELVAAAGTADHRLPGCASLEAVGGACD